MLDEYWFGDTGRISPEAPVPVVRAQSTEQRAGGAANVAVNVAALGARATLLAIVGADERGRRLEELLVRDGVKCRFHLSRSQPTIYKLRVLARSQQLLRIDAEQPLDADAAAVGELFGSAVDDSDVVVLSDYGKGTLTGIADLIATCRAAGVPVLVDPKGREFERYRGADVLTPNVSEFRAVAGDWSSEAEFLEKAARLREDLKVRLLLVTRGDRGMTLVRKNAEPVTLPAEAREVFDVTGAGDTVIATMAAALGAGVADSDAAELANLAAGLVCAKIGAATVTPSELLAAQHLRVHGRGAVSLEALEAMVAEAKARGERIVMTNGCFDLLHAGHVSYLEEARKLGDRLIVAVNDDESVRRLKGPDRPVTPLADRMAVLGGLAAVDWVVPFGEDTPAQTVRRLVPDVLVKGGDWAPEDIVGSDTVLAAGGEVRSLKFEPGRSTSALIAAIRNETG